MLRTPITPGALSLICIYIAFQKVPNLFSFTLNPANRHHFSLFDSTSLSPPSLQKKKTLTPNIPLMSCKYLCTLARSLLCSSPLASPLLLSCMPISFSTYPCNSIVEEVCTVVLNFPIQILWIISIGKQQERTWRHGVLLDTWLLFKKEIKREKLRKEWCGANLQDVIIYVLLSGRPALCVYRIN